MEDNDKNKKNRLNPLLILVLILLSLFSIFLIVQYFTKNYKNKSLLPKLTLELYNPEDFLQYDY